MPIIVTPPEGLSGEQVLLFRENLWRQLTSPILFATSFWTDHTLIVRTTWGHCFGNTDIEGMPALIEVFQPDLPRIPASVTFVPFRHGDDYSGIRVLARLQYTGLWVLARVPMELPLAPH